MLRRTLQRLVRLSPRAARLAWQALPESARSRLSPLVHPIAAGPRTRAAALPVERPARPARYDVVVGPGATLAAAERARFDHLGHRVINLGDATPAELAREERVLDAVCLVGEGMGAITESAQRLGWRMARDAQSLDSAFPEVTIVVPTHAARDLCQCCLFGLIRSTAWGRHRIVVVDDGSSDGTADMLVEIAATEPRLSVVRLDPRRGFAAACNAGIGRATGDYVVLLNDDTVVAPGWLSRLVAHLERDPKLGLVCPVTNQIGNDAQIQVSYESLEEMESLALERAITYAGESFETQAIALFCAAMRRELIEELGGLDERYEIGMFEDDDLSLSLGQRGYHLAVARDAFVHHVGQATFGKLDDAEYLAIWEANKRRFEAKWGRRWAPRAR